MQASSSQLQWDKIDEVLWWLRLFICTSQASKKAFFDSLPADAGALVVYVAYITQTEGE